MQLPPPPPIATATTQVETWQVGAITCDGAPVAIVRAPAPAGAVGYGVPGRTQRVQYRFTIDATGRPLDVAADRTDWVPFGDDLAPALAAARFAPAARTGCAVAFTSREQPLALVPPPELFALVALAAGTPSAALRERIDAMGDCGRPYPTLSVRVFPDYPSLPKLPGAPSWTVTRFDISGAGRPVNIMTVGGIGNAALDRAATDALRRSRFRPGARHGCLWPTRIPGETLLAPPAPTEAAFRPAGATCPARLPFDRYPTLTYPPAWQRRSIEGWAMIGYDVAPWGQIGNVHVLAAEPAAAFGEGALAVIRSATKPAGTTGYVGCVDLVRFRIGDRAGLRIGGQPLPVPSDDVVLQ